MSNILIGISGGIAAYKACDLISMLRKDGNEVRVVLTEHAKEFVTVMTLATLSRHPVMDNMWAERNGNVDHIDVGKWANKFVVYPATANIIAKFANGISDDLLSTIYLALPPETQRWIFPAMNTNMLNHTATQRNLKALIDDKILVMDTRETELACRDFGKGAVLSPKEAFQLITATARGYKKVPEVEDGCYEQKFVYGIYHDDLGGPVPSDVTCGGLETSKPDYLPKFFQKIGEPDSNWKLPPKDYSNYEVPMG